MPVFDSQNASCLDFHLVLALVNVVVVLILEVDLIIGDDLVVRQTHFRVDEEFIAVHKERTEVSRAQSLACPQHFVLS